MYRVWTLVYTTIGGDIVWPSGAEVDRINRASVKATKAIQLQLEKDALKWADSLQKKYPKSMPKLNLFPDGWNK